MRHVRSRTLAVLFAAVLSGCGGGGGDGGSSPTPTPSAKTPLRLDTSNQAVLAVSVPSNGERLLAFAQLAVDSVRRFALPASASPVVQTCPNGGLLTVSLVDHDGDGAASSGDRVSIQWRDCDVPIVRGVLNGTMDIAVDAASIQAPAFGLKGVISLGGGVSIGGTSSGGVTTRLLGTVQFDWTSDDWRTSLHVSATAADDLRLTATAANGSTLTDAIRSPDLSKNLHYDEARSIVSMSYRLESEALKGSVVVSTPDTILAYLNTYPESGRIQIAGASGSSVTLTPSFVSDSDRYAAAFDSNGDGIIEYTGRPAWADATSGYLWADSLTRPTWGAQAPYTRFFLATDFSPSFAYAWTGAASTAYRLQFSRLPAATTPPLYGRFWDLGPTSTTDPLLANVDAIVERRGALLIARPTQPLRHGHSYWLQISSSASDWETQLTIQDTLGNSTSNWEWFGLRFTTPDNVHAYVTAGSGVLLNPTDQLHLSGSNSTVASGAVAAYRWRQLSGTPLIFDTPDAAETNVSWGPTPPTGLESAVIALTVTDASGDADIAQLSIQSGNIGSPSHVLYFRSAPGDYIGAGKTALYIDASGNFRDSSSSGSFQMNFNTLGYADSWGLNLASASGTPLTAGAYENAIRFSLDGSPGLDFFGSGRGCNQTAGRFDVLELQTDGGGNVIRLAVDFEQHCGFSGAPPLYGSYRVNSSIPIRR